MAHRRVIREPVADVDGVVSKKPAHAKGRRPGAIVAPLVQRVDRDAEEFGDFFDGQELLQTRLAL